MGFVIWYKLEIDEPPAAGAGLLGAVKSFLGVGLPVKVSNDILSGAAYIVDSDIKVSLQTGAVASTFELKITNLPTDTTELLKSKHDDGQKNQKPLQVKVFLGYFDDLPQFMTQTPVLEGAIIKLKSDVNDAGLMETTIKGQELSGYRLRTTCSPRQPMKGEQTVEDILKNLLSDTGIELDSSHGLTTKYSDFTPQGRTLLETIRRLAENLAENVKDGRGRLGVPVVVRDKKLRIFKSVGAGDPVATLGDDIDIVKEDADHDSEEPKETQRRCSEDKAATGGGGGAAPSGEADGERSLSNPARASLALTVLGNPKLHPGEMVTVKHVNKQDEHRRIEQVEHRFSMTAGFTTELRLVDAKPGEAAADPGGAHGVVQRFQDLAEATEKTPIDVGEVSDYQAGADNKHLATLNYGQDAAPGQIAPSVTAPVNQQGSQLLNKPIGSPFAFHKTGLVVPVYPKMRAVLAHNQGATNDAIVAGFLWSEDPRMEPPKNKPGDYWLCLPTELSNGLPSGKGVNDLTDAQGERVIQAKGLKIFVGTDKLPDVGERPAVPESLAGTIVIEHQNGATVTITKDGAINITTDNQDISLTNGTVSLKLSGASVEVS
jgi:hypothetical protein